MSPLFLALILAAPSAMVRVPQPPASPTCSTSVQSARTTALAAARTLDATVAAGDIIALDSLERLNLSGTPIIPPARAQFVDAVDCLTDRLSLKRQTAMTASDATLALRAARIALAYRRPAEAVSRLEQVVTLGAKTRAAKTAAALLMQVVVQDEGETHRTELAELP